MCPRVSKDPRHIVGANSTTRHDRTTSGGHQDQIAESFDRLNSRRSLARCENAVHTAIDELSQRVGRISYLIEGAMKGDTAPPRKFAKLPYTGLVEFPVRPHCPYDHSRNRFGKDRFELALRYVAHLDLQTWPMAARLLRVS